MAFVASVLDRETFTLWIFFGGRRTPSYTEAVGEKNLQQETTHGIGSVTSAMSDISFQTPTVSLSGFVSTEKGRYPWSLLGRNAQKMASLLELSVSLREQMEEEFEHMKDKRRGLLMMSRYCFIVCMYILMFTKSKLVQSIPAKERASCDWKPQRNLETHLQRMNAEISFLLTALRIRRLCLLFPVSATALSSSG
jgi:hypothetical protein